MPRIIPDADDLARMTPSQKAKIRRYVAKVALELDDHAHKIMAAQRAKRESELEEWGEAVRRHARNLQAIRPPDPPHLIRSRRQALLEAIR